MPQRPDRSSSKNRGLSDQFSAAAATLPTAATRPVVIVVLLAIAAVAQGGLAVTTFGAGAVPGVLAAVIALAEAALATAVLVRHSPGLVLGAAVVGMLGIACFVLVAILSVSGSVATDGWVGPWGIGAAVANSMVVRIAAVVLRRPDAAAGRRG
ncbi:MAG: hypothetical protein OJJ54_06175 [Pseudonocardia sp.]|nr:hypothetical protein [Pseudonocardia sp.]